MEKNRTFLGEVCALAIPVALQSMLQSSFSMVDQIMIGQLGGVSVAGVGLAGKFAWIYSVVISAIGAAAGIMISQYLGQKNGGEVRRSFFVNLLLGVGIAGAFTAACLLFPGTIMLAYTTDPATGQVAAEYLKMVSGTFFPMAGATLLSTMFRCTGQPRVPLYASILSAVMNTGLNWVLIFGRLGFPVMGVAGAAAATVMAQWANFLLMMAWYAKDPAIPKTPDKTGRGVGRMNWAQYLSILLPLLGCEMIWSLGENVYAAIYGHMSTDAAAAMTLINPIQGMVTGALCGLSQAAGVLVGKRLGSGDRERAYTAAKRLMWYGLISALTLSLAVFLLRGPYLEIYRVSETVKEMTRQVLVAYSVVAPFKVLNMILGGGIIRSGGRTKYGMFIDMIGTWGFGVPLGLLSAFVFRLSIPYVYFILSLEECVRFGITMVVFRGRKWMNRLEAGVE